MGRLLILSPHPDDAVWSLGGALPHWQKEGEVAVVSCFDGDAAPAALAQLARPEHRWRRFGSAALRRQEDAAALALLGCPLHSLGLNDAATRLDLDAQFECPDAAALFLAPDYPSWPRPPVGMHAQLQALLRPSDTLIAPLALGRHVDHCLVHRLARESGVPVRYYAEFPYLLALQKTPQNTLAEHCDMLRLVLEEAIVPADWARWLTAAGRYRSQVLSMFGSHAALAAQLADYSGAAQGPAVCRIWSMH
jgi:LmbE family N-acetylglucosaminyl deacetylase